MGTHSCLWLNSSDWYTFVAKKNATAPNKSMRPRFVKCRKQIKFNKWKKFNVFRAFERVFFLSTIPFYDGKWQTAFMARGRKPSKIKTNEICYTNCFVHPKWDWYIFLGVAVIVFFMFNRKITLTTRSPLSLVCSANQFKLQRCFFSLF